MAAAALSGAALAPEAQKTNAHSTMVGHGHAPRALDVNRVPLPVNIEDWRLRRQPNLLVPAIIPPIERHRSNQVADVHLVAVDRNLGGRGGGPVRIFR